MKDQIYFDNIEAIPERPGIISTEKYIERTIKIAKGEYKPKKDEPKIWFEA